MKISLMVISFDRFFPPTAAMQQERIFLDSHQKLRGTCHEGEYDAHAVHPL